MSRKDQVKRKRKCSAGGRERDGDTHTQTLQRTVTLQCPQGSLLLYNNDKSGLLTSQSRAKSRSGRLRHGPGASSGENSLDPSVSLSLTHLLNILHDDESDGARLYYILYCPGRLLVIGR